ncbi:MAG: outer membrane lipid asymmetry maintenance protein MlaD [Magnetovibrio sp.]|nr:outer membrane lipid asymmetry maintenance protein MlaD [Magnetovibrio sp.]
MSRSAIETVMGGAVVLVAATFVYFVSNTTEINKVTGYELNARFFNAGGLTKGADVQISGIKIGSVSENRLDPVTFEAVVTLSIRPDIQLPKDTVAAIASSGMLGDMYLQLKPGTAKEVLSAGASIEKTKDYRSLEDQVGEIIFLATGGDGKPSH